MKEGIDVEKARWSGMQSWEAALRRARAYSQEDSHGRYKVVGRQVFSGAWHYYVTRTPL